MASEAMMKDDDDDGREYRTDGGWLRDGYELTVENDVSVIVREFGSFRLGFLRARNVVEDGLVDGATSFLLRGGCTGTGAGLAATASPRPVGHVAHDALEPVLRVLRVVGATVVKVDNLVPDLGDGLGRQSSVDREAVAAAALPSRARDPAAADLVQAARARLGHLVAAEQRHQRRDVLRFERPHHLLGHDRPRHVRAGVRRDGVDQDVVLCTLTRQGTREAKDGEFLDPVRISPSPESYRKRRSTWTPYRRCVVGLPKVPVYAARARGVDDAARLLSQEVRPGGLGDLVRAPHVYRHDLVPQLVVHVGKGLVSKDAGVVDDNVYAAKGVHGGLDDDVAVLGRGLDGNSRAAHPSNLLDDRIGVDEIVDDDGSAELREQQRICATEAVKA